MGIFIHIPHWGSSLCITEETVATVDSARGESEGQKCPPRHSSGPSRAGMGLTLKALAFGKYPQSGILAAKAVAKIGSRGTD